MRTSHIFGITLIFITLVFMLASVNFDQPEVSARNLNAASLSTQIATPTPNGPILSEEDLTDGIVIMGFVLVAIVTLPVLFYKKLRKK